MTRSPYPLLAGLLVLAALSSACADGCGAGDLTFPGSFPTPTAVPTTTCGAVGTVCSLGADCCSGVCDTTDGVNFTCQ